MAEIKVSLVNRQRKIRCDMAWLRQLAPVALQRVLALPVRKGAVLATLPEVGVTIVSDARIAQIHADFMAIPDPTDVITFHHGEIIISAETAAANATRYRRSLDEEIALYLVHGLLHLHGYLDKSPADFALMQKTQTAVLRFCLEAAKSKNR
ncbi:MAG: rRNA maturation RNase YbeY [Chthoniobacteraceae bacterium]